MIAEYHRPKRIVEAVELLSRTDLPAYPLAGGTRLNQNQPLTKEFIAVDLQELGLDHILSNGNVISLGAMVTLQSLLDFFQAQSNDFQFRVSGLLKAIKHEATYNLRQIATIGGTLISGDGRSPLTTMLLAADTSLGIISATNIDQEEYKKFGDILPFRSEVLIRKLVTTITIPINTDLVYEYVARTPADLPIVCAASSCWSSGRTRIALGGFGAEPVLAFDGNDLIGVEEASRSAYSMAEDEWASKEYRSEMAALLTRRCLFLNED